MRQPIGPGTLAFVLVLVLVLAGCLGGASPSATPGSSPTTVSTQEVTETVTVSQGFEPANESAPLSVELVNERGTWVEMRLRVSVVGTDETGHTESHEVAPNSQPWTVYELPRDGRSTLSCGSATNAGRSRSTRASARGASSPL